MGESAVVAASVAQPTPRSGWRRFAARGGSHWTAAIRFLLLILALYLCKQMFSVAAYYPFSGHDELAHFSYIRTVATEHRLPVLPDLETWREGLRGGEAPPTDNLASDLYRYCRYALAWFCAPDNPRWRDNPRP